MNPSFNPKLSELPAEILRGEIRLLVGFSGELLYKLMGRRGGRSIPISEKHSINPVMFRCWKCQKELPEIALPGKLRSYSLRTQQELTDVEAPHFLESIRWCDACSDDHEKHMTRLVCNKCNQIVALVEAGRTDTGFEVKPGMTLHCAECPKCTPGCTQVSILEMTCQPSSTSSTTSAPETATSTDAPPQAKPH